MKKGINVAWLSEVDLTNLNSGEGESNYIDVKKYKKDGVEYPYVSGQAMRHYFRDAIRRATDKYICVPDDRGETCGDIENCIGCDLFGFMLPKKGSGSSVRVSPLKVSPAIGLLSFEDNSTVDFLTRSKYKEIGEKTGGDIVNIEIGTNIYKCGISIDIERIGGEEVINDEERKLSIEYKVDNNERKERIKLILDAIRYLSDYSKQARLLTDFTPDILVASVQDRYSHRLQKALEIDESRTLNIDRLKEILEDVGGYGDIYFGMISGVVTNEDEVKDMLNGLEIEVLTPNKALKKVMDSL
ncbi:type I-B CRISPR-associated protein Cas7/Cst2/DevR [Methanothermococcus thermolithotrophicus]|jgi:CRISPR-associated protein Cst2|uniref:type I-B CRISPR-associated protein Cas7/Cst2/DevR n=1 Tax=Methanothermococcus thermolithotrophicus TaxID=2186 RepID=UPI0003784B53|nr:type I-B CRISPR-associated protein Cas7/Cst2/DevR [Methanothermococcus thermolithotrophicus]